MHVLLLFSENWFFQPSPWKENDIKKKIILPTVQYPMCVEPVKFAVHVGPMVVNASAGQAGLLQPDPWRGWRAHVAAVGWLVDDNADKFANAASVPGRSERDGHPQLRVILNMSSIANRCKPAHEKLCAQPKPSLLHKQADASQAQTITNLYSS